MVPPNKSENPLTKWLIYDADNVAPHAQTIRDFYTVPPRRIAHIDNAFCRVSRATVGTPGTTARCFNRIVRNKISYPFNGCEIGNNTVGDNKSSPVGDCGWVFPGDTIDITTKDDNIDGAVNYSICIQITEYDY